MFGRISVCLSVRLSVAFYPGVRGCEGGPKSGFGVLFVANRSFWDVFWVLGGSKKRIWLGICRTSTILGMHFGSWEVPKVDLECHLQQIYHFGMHFQLWEVPKVDLEWHLLQI